MPKISWAPEGTSLQIPPRNSWVIGAKLRKALLGTCIQAVKQLPTSSIKIREVLLALWVTLGHNTSQQYQIIQGCADVYNHSSYHNQSIFLYFMEIHWKPSLVPRPHLQGGKGSGELGLNPWFSLYGTRRQRPCKAWFWLVAMAVFVCDRNRR